MREQNNALHGHSFDFTEGETGLLMMTVVPWADVDDPLRREAVLRDLNWRIGHALRAHAVSRDETTELAARFPELRGQA